MNFHPFYETIELGSGELNSVTAILEKGRRWMQAPRRGYYDHWGPILRWITDKSTAFVRKDDSDVSSLREDAKAWYCNKGRCLTSEPVDTDDTLWKRLHRGSASIATGELEIQLYLVAPATQPTKVRFDTGVHAEQIRRMYILDYQPVSEELWYPDSDGSDTDKDNSILTRMAALYEPAFAYAQNALQRGLQDVPLSDSGGNHEEEGNARSDGEAINVMVREANGEDNVLDTHLFMAQLRDALNGLKAGCPDSESKENASAHGVALGKVLQLLFDDPTLKVQVKLTGFGRRGGPLPRIKIEAECPTPCGIPALYVVADDRLTSLRDRNPKRKEWGMQESMIAYRDTILITGHFLNPAQRSPPAGFALGAHTLARTEFTEMPCSGRRQRDTHLFMAQLRDALNGLKAGCPDSESKENASAHGVALGKVLQLLFDDPTLKVQVKLTGFGRRGGPLPRIKIEAECPTPCGIPALYVVADDRLTSLRDRNPKRKEWGMQESMIAYRDTILITGRAPIHEATCSPCLVIGTAGAAIRIFAAYFADRIYRTHLCDFALDVDTDSDAQSDAVVATKVRVIRNTARMLREMYTRVHVGAHLLPPNHTCRPHLLPRPAILMPVPAPLPVHLSLLERVTRGQNSYVFTGTLTLHARHGTDDSAESSERELPVHVKFVEEYSVAAHRLLAAHTDPTSGAPRPLAPQLYWAGEVVPGLLMIVMETSPPTRACSDFTPEPQYKPVKRAELGDLRAAVQLLHAHGFVHGDLREVNVMLQRCAADSDASSTSENLESSGSTTISTSTGEAPRAYLIDFDRAGKEGSARYPMGLNPNVKWPRPVSEMHGQLITKEDDMFMLEKMLQELKEPEPEGGDGQDEKAHKRKRSREQDDVDKCKHKRDDTSDKMMT
ncbi:hypothetical protein GSI_08107 [Ganoderma sinense ZZ0214-1]|uniref:Uncharacterized protein n=1 Tax=Ganoderma sinense ZZ0214-1 TaxID=1077348 RepID=A0A2G8S7B3_9APHY|nr:hypothetical protein GSI_08107 [Ganoderma sinense ZZ0214-1]